MTKSEKLLYALAVSLTVCGICGLLMALGLVLSLSLLVIFGTPAQVYALAGVITGVSCFLVFGGLGLLDVDKLLTKRHAREAKIR